jgi:hypothetical protein|nr:MAG TPA: Putative amidoligase enzyme [Crassvirales sp.]
MTLTLFNKPIKENKKYRRIQGELYEENRSVFLIEGKWRRIIAPGIYIDMYNKVSKIPDDVPLIKCLIGRDKNNNLIFTKMDSRCYNKIMVLVNNNGIFEYYWAWPDLCLENMDLKFNNCRNFYYESSISKSELDAFSKSFKYESPFIYNSYDLIDLYEKIKENVFKDDKKITINPMIEEYLKDVTFGIEFETSKIKFVPNDILMKYGLIPLRDGSIRGYEYTTIPLTGTEGIQDLYYICKALKENCEYDKSCSVHIHMSIKGMPKKDIKFIERILNLGLQIQNEIYEIVPEYKYCNYNHEKEKNYTKPIPALSLESLYVTETKDEETNKIEVEKNNIPQTSIASFLIGTNDDSILIKGIHPSNPDNQHKWNIKERYFWLNTIPYFFNNGTIENRMMEATFDFQTILDWIILTASLIKFAMDENNKDKIVDMLDVAEYTKNKEVIKRIAILLKK